jgi:hypothetical protein
MRSKPASEQAVKLSVSLPPEYVAWMKRGAKKQRVSLSFFLRQAITPAFDGRHAK